MAESEKLQNMGYQIINAYVLHPGNCYFSVENETIEADTVMNMFDSTAFSEQLEKDENIKEHIHEGIQCLSEKYPDYDITQTLNTFVNMLSEIYSIELRLMGTMSDIWILIRKSCSLWRSFLHMFRIRKIRRKS